MKRFLALFAALLLAMSGAAAADAPTAEEIRSGILNFKAAQSGAENVSDWVAAHLPAAMGRGGEWYAIALSHHGEYDLSACRRALLEYVGSTAVRSATTRQKLALTLLATGGEADFVTSTLGDAIGTQGVMSWAWGLELLNNGCESPEYTAEDIIGELLSLRKADGGWAVTGEVRGADGKPRRWLYRYAGNVLRPVLLWQDPSGQARRVLSAAVIRHTGLQQQTLAGLHLEAVMGLDVPPDGGAPSPRDQLAPGLEALDALAREIHRYGGWAMQADILPPSLTPLIQRAPVDLTRDTVTSPAAEYALLTGDAAPLASLLRQSMNSGVRQEGLARGLHQWQGVDWRPLRDLPGGEALFQRACRLAGLHDDEYFWPTTPAGLAREALGRKPDAVPARDRRDAELEEACLLLLAWRVGLPGLAFVSPQELQGALPLPKSTPGTAASAGLVPLLEPETAAGEVEPAPLAFGPLSEELRLPRSPASIMARLLHARAVSGVARGRLLRVVSGPAGTLATVTRLPDGSCWVLAANFGSASATLRIPLPVSGAAQDIVEQTSLAVQGGLTVTLNGRSARHYLVGAAASPKEPS